MSNDKNVTLTSSEIISENKKNEKKINDLSDKAEKLSELIGNSIQFDRLNLKELKSDITVEKIEIENVEKIEPATKPVVEDIKIEEPVIETSPVEEIIEEVKVEETTPTPVVEEVIPAKEQEVKKESKKVKKEIKKPNNNKSKNNNNVSFTGYYEKVVGVKKISKTTKGGRHMRFSALVIIGDKNGTVGYGKGKSIEVPVAIRKALKDAKNNLRKVKINKNGTLYHEVIGKQGAGKVLIKPAPTGTGIIAGGPIRVVLELAGYKDVYSKNLGKNTSINMVLATLNGLDKIRSPKEIAFLRDKNLKDL